MQRSHVSTAAAEHERLLLALASAVQSLQPGADGTVQMPLCLDLLPSLLQYLLSTRSCIEQHVAYQTLERLALQAVGLDRLMPPQRYENLREFETSLLALCGERCIHFLHGQGWAAEPISSGSMDARANAARADLSNAVVFLSKHNSGFHSVDTIRRALPAADMKGGAQLHSILNFYESAVARAGAVTFTPPGASDCRVILCDMSMDGLMLGAGTTVDEHALQVVGLRRRVRCKEAARVLEMDDVELAAWFADNPALQTAVRAPRRTVQRAIRPLMPTHVHSCMHSCRVVLQVEYMISTADHATTGHIGFNFVVTEGDHKQVARGLAEMLSATRVCLGCLQAAWRDGMGSREATAVLRHAKAACDSFCACNDDAHWTARACTRCRARGMVCTKLYVLGATIDCGGNQHGLINRSFDGTLETEDAPYHASGGARLHGVPVLPDLAHLNKSLDGNTFHNKVWLRNCLCGAFQLWSRYWDADETRRTAVRAQLTRELLRRKNAFSVEAAVQRHERHLLRALLSDEERTACCAWLVSTLGPARCRPWRENTPSMYGHPMGIAYHALSNLIFYVDRTLKQGRVLKLSHTPCDNAAFTAARGLSAASQLRTPIDIALVGTNAYITDAHHTHPALYVVSIAHVCKSFSSAEAGGEQGAAGRGAVKRVKLRGRAPRQPFGIAADVTTGELFVGCRTACAVLCVTLSSTEDGVVETFCELPAPPSGIDFSPATTGTPARLVVAVGDAVFLVHRASRVKQRVFQRDGASLCGVRFAPPGLGGALFIMNETGNAVLRLGANTGSGASTPFLRSDEATVLVGGNTTRQSAERGTFWYEGTANRVELALPTFGVFARNAFVFTNPGRGEHGKVLLLNDLYPMVETLGPAMLTTADACGLSADAEHHALDRLHAALMLESLNDLLLEIEDDNADVRGARGLQGEMGNFSNVVRKSCRQLPQLLLQQVADAAQIGAPPHCLDALSITSITTLDVETFFIGQRAHWPNPLALQYSKQHCLTSLLESARRGDVSFSFCSSRSNPAHSTRSHYHRSGGRALAERRYQLHRQKPLAMSIGKRSRQLKTLRAFAAIFKQARQQRVTDKGKEKPGTQPAPFYAPRVQQAGPLTASEAGGESDAGKITGGTSLASEDVQPVYRSGDLVVVRPPNAPLWLAQLLEAVVEEREGHFNTDRPRCQYFVPTVELGAYLHALAWWQARGEALRLEDEEAAIARAGASNGVHFSFEKTDHVTRSTICGRLPATCLSEVVLFRHDIVAFAISDTTLEEAREMVSTSTAEAKASDAAMQQAAATRLKAEHVAAELAAATAAEQAAAAHAKLNQKREAGKAKEDAKRQK